jgi:hypothetical protein
MIFPIAIEKARHSEPFASLEGELREESGHLFSSEIPGSFGRRDNFLSVLDCFCYDDDYAWPIRIPGASDSAEFAESGGCVQHFLQHYYSLHYSVHY